MNIGPNSQLNRFYTLLRTCWMYYWFCLKSLCLVPFVSNVAQSRSVTSEFVLSCIFTPNRTEQNRTEPNGTERGRLIKKLSRLMLSCLILIVLHAVKTNLNAWYFESGTAHTHTSLYIQLNVWALVVVFHFIGDVMQYCHCARCDSKICLFNWNSISNVYVSVCPTCAMHFMHFEYDSNWYSWVYAEQFKWNPKHVLI